MPVSADRYANEFFSSVSPDGRTLAMSARGIASGQWWRRGHSHIDEAEIWLRDLTAADAPAAYRGITAGGAKDLWPMWVGRRRVAVLRLRSQRRRRTSGRATSRPDLRAGRGAASDRVQGRPGPVAVDLRARRHHRVRARVPDLEARHRDGQSGGRADHADRRAGRAVDRAAAADEPVRRISRSRPTERKSRSRRAARSSRHRRRTAATRRASR